MHKHKKLISGIKSYFKKNNCKKAVIGLSGGVDSALCALLVAKAIGSRNLTALLLPETGLSSQAGVKDSLALAKQLKIKPVLQPINKFLAGFKKLPWKQSKLAEMNLRARARAVAIYSYANSNNALVIGTGNRSELLLGYFTKYGDSAADLLVIGSLWKTEVVEMARELGIPEKITGKPPSAELFARQTDEAELGASYEKIDPILKLLEKGASEKKITQKGHGAKLVKSIARRVATNQHKRKPVPIIKC